MVWAGIAAAGVMGAASLLGNSMQSSASKNLMAKQYHYNKQMMQNAHQWTVEDLKKAGLNPVLSASQGANTGSGVGLPQAPDYAGSLQSAVDVYQNQQRIKNETEVATATADNQEAQADKTRKESGWIDPKTNAEIKESESRTAENKAKINEINTNQELLRAQRIEALNNAGMWGKFLLMKHFGGQVIEGTSKQIKKWKEEHDKRMKEDPKYRKMWEDADLTEGIFS